MKPKTFRLNPLIITVVAGVVLLGTGCKDRSIQVYTIPKEVPKQAKQIASESAPSIPHLHWDELPSHWTELPASDMRAASLMIQGSDGTKADVVAIPLPMMDGRELQFVNLWRSDLNLTEISTDAIAELRDDATILGNPGSIFEMVSDELLVDGKFRKRLVVAMTSLEGYTWFFKLTGPDPLVTFEKQNFIYWMENVEIHAGSHGEPAPQMSSTSSQKDLPQWRIPDGWTPQQPGQMLLARFALAGGDASVTVMALGGDGGGLLQNINRWRGQLGLAKIDSGQLNEYTESIDTVEGNGTLVDMQGNDQRILAVIIPHKGKSWFYKSMGATDAVTQEHDAFVQFVRTAKH